MLASSFLDLVLGLDVHFEMVPTPVPVPTPIPNPFVGLVYDPKGLAAGLILGAVVNAVLGAPILGPVLYWGIFPATNTGTEARHVTGHILIPPGVAWAPFPKTPKPVIHPGETPKPALPVKPENDAVVITGSKTVTVMGSNAARLGDIALSCSEPLRLPSSLVVAVPKGAPIVIGGPPSLDILAAFLGSLRTRFLSDTLHALLSRMKPGRFRSFLKWLVCFFTGHPVDVASGKVMTQCVDAELPGPLPLRIERVYSSAFAARPGPVGHGWSLSVDQGVWRERGRVVLLAEDGREIEFDTFELPGHSLMPGQRVYHPIERLTLHCEDEGRWRVVEADGTTRLFAPVPGRGDGRALLCRVLSTCEQHELLFYYDAQGLLERIRDSGGRILRLTYDDSRRLIGLHLPRPQGEGHYLHRRYAYDAEGDLIEVVDALRAAWRFAYVTHLLTQETDRNGLSFYFAYDGVGEDAWCVRTWGDGGIFDHVLAYDKPGRVTYVTDSRGATRRYHMNVVGQVVKVVEPLGGETVYRYDPTTLRLVECVDAAGAREQRRYDESGNLREFITPDGARFVWEYDAHNRALAMVDGNGGRWRWRYDIYHRLITTTDPCGAVTHRRYKGGFLAEIHEPCGGVIAVRHDEQGNLCALRSPDGSQRQWEYDRLGRVVAVESPRGARQTRVVDAEGCVRETSDDGVWQRYDYDAEGQIVGVRDRGHAVKFTYWKRDRLAAREEAGELVQFEYDTEGRVAAVVDPLGRRHRYVRDANGAIVREIGFDGSAQRFDRDRVGRIIRHTRASGRALSYVRDICGRVVRVEDGEGAAEVFAYRSDGLLMAADNADCELRLERDLVGRIVCERQSERWVTSTYDRGGRRVRAVSSLGSDLRIYRDAMGVATGIEQSAPSGGTEQTTLWDAKHRPDPTGASDVWDLPGGVQRGWSFTSDGRPTLHRIHGRSGVLLEQSYEFAENGPLTRKRDRPGGETIHTHDSLGNLVHTRGPGDADVGRHVDAAGNLYRREDLSDRSYDRGGRLLAVADEAGARRERHYDVDGFLVRQEGPDGVWSYRWDAWGRLKEVSPPGGLAIQFTYDALGRRLSKQQGERVTRWVWDRLHLLHEQQGPADRLVTWVFEPESFSPLARLAGPVALSVVGDHLGAPLAMFDERGGLVWRGDLDSWGALHLEHGERSDCPLRWPGQYEDEETGLYYNRNRYYDPAAGAYISPDPLRRLGGLSDYGYAADPTVWIDPFGLIVLYHYTDEAGMNGILKSNEIWPSTEPKNTKFGKGQYFSNIPPSKVAGQTLKDLSAADKAADKISLGQLANVLYHDARRMSTVTHFVAVDIDDSLVKFCRDGTFVILNEDNLPVKGKIKDHGETC